MTAVTHLPAHEALRTNAVVGSRQGWWSGSDTRGVEDLVRVLREIQRPFYVVGQAGAMRLAFDGLLYGAASPPAGQAYPVLDIIPASRCNMSITLPRARPSCAQSRPRGIPCR